jgi:4-hydroxyphenylpyruvate dioxygenase-like putative hemolysin
MNAKKRSYEPEYAAKHGATIKTMNLQVAATEPDLKSAVRAAFTLAKSGGRELNLDFNLQALAQTVTKRSNRMTPQFASL